MVMMSQGAGLLGAQPSPQEAPPPHGLSLLGFPKLVWVGGAFPCPSLRVAPPPTCDFSEGIKGCFGKKLPVSPCSIQPQPQLAGSSGRGVGGLQGSSPPPPCWALCWVWVMDRNVW